MNQEQIQLDNLRILIAEKGTIAAVADAAKTAPAYLSQINTGTLLPSGKPRVVGKELARKLEEGCGKPEGWMNQRHTVDKRKQLLDECYEKLSDQQKDQLLQIGNTFTQSAEKKPNNGTQ